MRRTGLAAIASTLVALAVATAAEPTSGPADWQALANEQTITVVTTNSDGSPRQTTIWLVVVDGKGYIRTGNTRWGRNVERNPDVVLGIAGTDYPLRAVRVTDPALLGRVSARFREKYGFSDRVRGWFAPLFGETRIFHVVARPGPRPGAAPPVGSPPRPVEGGSPES